MGKTFARQSNTEVISLASIVKERFMIQINSSGYNAGRYGLFSMLYNKVEQKQGVARHGSFRSRFSRKAWYGQGR